MINNFDISIIIVNYNVRHFIVECLESIKRSKLATLSIEIFIVDNASIDGSVEVISTQYPEVNLIANKDNLGFSKANNQAIKLANGKYILLLNPDTVLEEETLDICFNYMETHQEVGALGVRMIDGAGIFLPESKRSFPTAWNSFTKLVGMSSLFPKSKLFNGYALGHLPENQQHNIQVLCGAFMFISKTALDKVGMLDERFFMYGEDIDLSYRIIKGGYQIHYIPETTIIHYKGESTKKGSLNYVKTFYNAMGLYVDKHYQNGSGSLFGKFLKIGIWLRASLSAGKRLISSFAPKLLDGFLIFGGVYGFSQLWAKYYFEDTDYYTNTPLLWNIGLYALLWILVAWTIGYYKKSKWNKRLQAVLVGMILILGIYGLLDDSYRTSRVIILGGTLISWIILSITAHFKKSGRSSDNPKNVLIVAEKQRADVIHEQLNTSNAKTETVGIVYPKTGSFDNNIYVNNITQLNALTRVLKANEIIFSTEDMSTKEIMKTMMQLDAKLSFKIAGDESLNILGSKSKNSVGEIYDIDLNYNLNSDYYQHIKRVMDVIVSFCFILLFPITLAINKFALKKWFDTALGTLSGRLTWVGYNTNSTTANLPLLADPIYSTSDFNRDYARNYSIWNDLEVLLSRKMVVI